MSPIAPTKRQEKPNTQKKRFVSNYKCEPVQDNSNAVTPYRRYNVRSHSPSKAPVQLKTKSGNVSNLDSHFLMKRKGKKKDYMNVEKNSSSANNSYSPSSKSCKTDMKIPTKSHIPKFNFSPVSKVGQKHDKSEEKGFEFTNTLVPYKSILKGTSPTKSPHYANLNEKDIIKERIYGPSQQKKVMFKTMSCDNLKAFSYENIFSKDLKETEKPQEQLNEPALEEVNKNNGESCEPYSENRKDDTNIARLVLPNKEQSLKENVLQNQTKDTEKKNDIFMCKPKLLKISEEENILKELQILKTNIQNLKINNASTEIKNFRILDDVKSPKEVKINKIFQKIGNETRRDIQSFENGNQENTFNCIEESSEVTTSDNEPNLREGKKQNMESWLPRYSTKNITFKKQMIIRYYRSQGLLEKEFNEKPKLSTASLVKYINKKRERNMKTFTKNLNTNDDKIGLEKRNIVGTKCDNRNEILAVTAEEINDNLICMPKNQKIDEASENMQDETDECCNKELEHANANQPNVKNEIAISKRKRRYRIKGKHFTMYFFTILFLFTVLFKILMDNSFPWVKFI